MSKNVDLTSKEWCDLVFEGKNKAFGGYLLRVNSPKRYTWATMSSHLSSEKLKKRQQ